MGGILQVDTIQNNNTSNLITQTNVTTITIGVSGQTISIPAGATLNTTTIVLAAGAVGTPSLTTSGDTNTGIFFPAADTIGFAEGGTEVMRITSDGKVGIGTTTPTGVLEVKGTDTINHQYTGSANKVLFGQFNATGDASINNQANAVLIFGTNNTERMRIDITGGLAVGKTGSALGTAGAFIDIAGNEMCVLNNIPLYLNRLGNDGNLINFYQATTLEGNIAVSGATVSYNGFTGSHWSRFIDESKPDVLRGTVMESLDEMIDWYHAEFETSHTEKDADGNDIVKTSTQKQPYALKANEKEGDVITYNFEGTDYQATIVKQVDVKHVMSKISDTVEAKNVYGVFSAWDNDDLINNDFYVASVGSYVVRIKAGQTVSKGDLLQSNGDGTAKVQADDLVRASTFAKVLSNTVIQTYEDGSFIVPCSLMC